MQTPHTPSPHTTTPHPHPTPTQPQGVRPGKARMFHCLLVNAQQPDFSSQCRTILVKQVHKRTRDWRLDYGLQKYCGGDVPTLCATEAKDADRGTGVVIKCLVKKVESVSEGCARELSRVVSTALQFYEPVCVY